MTTTTYNFQRLLPSTDKVQWIQSHPQKPIIASFDRKSYLTVWDYSRKQAIFEAQFGAESIHNRDALDAVARNEADPDYFGRKYYPYLAANLLQPAAYGKLRSVHFMDYDALLWTVTTEHMMQNAVDVALPVGAHSSSAPDRCTLLITCDRALIVFDVVQQRAKSLMASSPVMGSRGFYLAIPLPRDPSGAVAQKPAIAVACSDGFVRVVEDVPQQRVVSIFALKSSTVVTAMAAVPVANRDALLVGDDKGNVYVFDPMQRPKTTEKGVAAIPPIHVFHSFHKERILDIVLAPRPDPTACKALVVTVSQCNRIGIWDMQTLASQKGTAWGGAELVGSLKPRECKVTGAAAIFSGAVQAGEATVLLSTSTPHVYGLSLAQPSAPTIMLANLSANIPPREAKKAGKLYGITAPCLRPSLAAVATNAGVALLTCSVSAASAVAGLPVVLEFSAAEAEAAAPSGDLLGMGDAEVAVSENPRAVSALIVQGNVVQGATYSAPDDAFEAAASSSRVDKANSSQLPVTCTSRATVCSLGFPVEPTDAKIYVHAAGNHIAVCSRRLHTYKVFQTADGGAHWNEVFKGSGGTVAWSSTTVCLAALVLPAPATPPTLGKSKKDAAIMKQMATRAQSSSSGSGAYVEVVNFRSPSSASPQRVSLTPGVVPYAVHGGALLGIAVQRSSSAASSSSANESASEELLWLDWDTRAMLTMPSTMPAPKFSAFSASSEFAALAHDAFVDVYHLKDELRHVARITARAPQSALWLDSTLFVATESNVTAHFIIPPAPPDQQLSIGLDLFSQVAEDGLQSLTGVPTAAHYNVQSIEIAVSTASTHQLNRGSSGTAADLAGLPAPALRPGVIFRLVRVTEESLWMATATGHAWAMSLAHPGLRCRLLVARGELRAARKLAAEELRESYHNGLATYMAAFGADAAAEAMRLPGITLQLELALAIQAGALPRAHSCLAALMWGCKDRAILQQMDTWRARDKAADAEAGDASGAAGDDPFAKEPTDAAAGARLNMPAEVIAIFKQAAGVQGQQVLKKLTQFGVQGRDTALDKDLFQLPSESGPLLPPGSGPGGQTPSGPGQAAAAVPPPSSTKFKPMFPRKAPTAMPSIRRTTMDSAAAAPKDAPLLDIDEAVIPEQEEDVIDWAWPLLPEEPARAEASDDAGGNTNGAAAQNGNGAEGSEEGQQQQQAQAEAKKSEEKEAEEDSGAANSALLRLTPQTIELGLLLLDAAVKLSDGEVLKAGVALMAPHTGVMTAAQQARLVAAVGACGLAKQLSKLTLSGTTPILPTAAMLAGFLAGDARVTARVLEKQSFLPLKALFVQSCGVGGIAETVQWETELRNQMGGPTRDLTITPAS